MDFLKTGAALEHLFKVLEQSLHLLIQLLLYRRIVHLLRVRQLCKSFVQPLPSMGSGWNLPSFLVPGEGTCGQGTCVLLGKKQKVRGTRSIKNLKNNYKYLIFPDSRK